MPFHCSDGIGRRAALGAVLAVALASACAQTPDTHLQPEYNSETGRLEKLRYDENRNGIAETTSYLQGSQIVRVEVDVNEDGRVDRWEHYGPEGRLEKVGFSRAEDGRENAWSFADSSGQVVQIDVAGSAGGLITRTEHFRDGALVRAEEDTNADGLVDKWEDYEQGRLVRLAFREEAGRPARALVYAADGSVRVEDAVPEPAAPQIRALKVGQTPGR